MSQAETPKGQPTAKKDDLYANPIGDIPGFTFDNHVVDVFPDMINRSVPGYSTVIAQTGRLARRFIQPNTYAYDLGCSLGASLLSMYMATQDLATASGCTLVGIDNSPAMIDRCQQLISKNKTGSNIELICDDINNQTLQPASVIVMNYTLQFLPLAARDQLIQKIANALVPGGILILSEKINYSDAAQQALNIEMHHDFKRANGYSDMEISQKRNALENVLIAETVSAHQKRLSQSGFKSAETWFQCFNFCSLIALKQ